MLPDKPILADYQDLIGKLVLERGFDKETPAEVFMLLLEEVGEFAKAIRKTSGMKTSDDSKTHSLEEEAADILWLLVDLCNRLDIDLEKAFREKEVKNQTRIWK
ncbi:MazG nucleotide pyrophosphohydrolase domain-containing protein [soil metagenome]